MKMNNIKKKGVNTFKVFENISASQALEVDRTTWERREKIIVKLFEKFLSSYFNKLRNNNDHPN